MAVMELQVALTVLMILYALAFFFGFLASVPMVLHVYPQSECLLFSTQYGDSLSYGHYASEFIYIILDLIFYVCRISETHISGPKRCLQLQLKKTFLFSLSFKLLRHQRQVVELRHISEIWPIISRGNIDNKGLSTIDLLIRLACFYYNTQIINCHKAAELSGRSTKQSN